MKIRTGLVSNSSSSSFIVLFPKAPKSWEEVQKLLFRDKITHEGYTTEEIAKIVYKDMQGQSTKALIKFTPTIKACIEVNGDIDLIMHRFFSDIENTDQDWEIRDYIENLQEGNDPFGTELKAKHGKGKIYTFTYADDVGEFYGMMEHSEIFNNLPYERISHH